MKWVIIAVLAVLFMSCVLDLTWAPVHDAPNNFNLHIMPTATPTEALING